MPTIGVKRSLLFHELGQKFSKYRPEVPDKHHEACFLADEEFDQLCFDYGIELDDIVRNAKHGLDMNPPSV